MLSLSALPGNSWLALPILAIILIFGPSVWNKSPKAPGPPLARFTNIWMGYRMLLGGFHKENMDLHRKYGSVVRVGPNYYSIDGLDASKQIYGHGTKFTKGEWYDGWVVKPEQMKSNLFAQRDVRMHASSRRRMASLYTMSSLVSYEPYVDACLAVFGGKLMAHGATRRSMDMTKWFQYYAYDVIGEITFSKRMGFMEQEKDQFDLIRTVNAISEMAHCMGLFRPMVALQSFIAPRLQNPLDGIINFAIQRIQEAKKRLDGDESLYPDQHERSAPDFVSKALKIEANADDGDNKTVWGTSLANLIAGSDTTTVTLNGIYFHLLTHPDSFAKLRAELDDATANGQLSDPVTFAETQKLPYLQAVLREGMRMHPATGSPMWRRVPAGGETICGYYFPEGCNVGINSWVAHHNRDVYGADADEFRPERWLETDEAKLKDMNAYFMSFGLGSRTCIGKNISLLEIAKVVPLLVRGFDVSLVGERGKWKELPARNAWFVKQKDFVVDVQQRAGST